MKSDDEKVLGKGIEAIFERTAHLMKGAGKTIELPNGVICREGDDLIVRLQIGANDDIRGALEELAEMARSGMLDDLVDRGKIRTQISEHLEMAQLAIEDKDSESAITELENCLKLNDIPAVRYNLALMLEKSGETDRAMKQYRLVIKTNPKDVEAMSNLGRLYYDKGDFTKAMEIFERAVKQNPNLGDGSKEGLFPKRFGFKKMVD